MALAVFEHLGFNLTRVNPLKSPPKFFRQKRGNLQPSEMTTPRKLPYIRISQAAKPLLEKASFLKNLAAFAGIQRVFKLIPEIRRLDLD